jgi:hypothetical protein
MKYLKKFEAIGFHLDDDNDEDIGPFSHWNEDSEEDFNLAASANFGKDEDGNNLDIQESGEDKSAGEYLMVVHFESGDEIHMDLLEMRHYHHIDSIIGDAHSDYLDDTKKEELVNYILDNKINDLMCQTYVLENYPFIKYNITKVIHIPDLGH